MEMGDSEPFELAPCRPNGTGLLRATGVRAVPRSPGGALSTPLLAGRCIWSPKPPHTEVAAQKHVI